MTLDAECPLTLQDSYQKQRQQATVGCYPILSLSPSSGENSFSTVDFSNSCGQNAQNGFIAFLHLFYIDISDNQ